MNIVEYKSILEQLYYTVIALVINFTISYIFYKFTNNLVNNEKFREYIKGGVEDGDDVLNFKDMIGTIMMLFGVMFFWLTLDIILGSLIFDNDKLTVVSAVFMMGASLFGVGKFVKKN